MVNVILNILYLSFLCCKRFPNYPLNYFPNLKFLWTLLYNLVIIIFHQWELHNATPTIVQTSLYLSNENLASYKNIIISIPESRLSKDDFWA